MQHLWSPLKAYHQTARKMVTKRSGSESKRPQRYIRFQVGKHQSLYKTNKPSKPQVAQESMLGFCNNTIHGGLSSISTTNGIIVELWSSAKERVLPKRIWRFPKMGVLPNHPFIDIICIINHPAIGVPPFMETPICLMDMEVGLSIVKSIASRHLAVSTHRVNPLVNMSHIGDHHPK